MINISLKDIVAKICKTSGLSEDEVNKKISEKVEQLYGLVSEEGAAHIIANEMGIKIFDISGELKIKDILIGMKSVDVVGKVLRKYELREFSTEKRKGRVANLSLADETGTIRVVFWNDKTQEFSQIKEDDIIKIKNAYVRENAGRKELHIGENSHIIINPQGINVIPRERPEYDRKHISELTDGITAEIFGTIVQVFDIRFFEVCPICNKRLRLNGENFECEEHGIQRPSYNYILNLYLDDGTANIRVNFWKQQTQRLLKLDDSQILKFMNSSDFESYKTELLGEQIKVLGRVKKNIMQNLEFTADLVFTDLNPDEEIAMLDHAKEIVLDTRQSIDHKNKVNQETFNQDDDFEISEEYLE
ncbi:MAG: hypothetical protein KatS3mg002_0492 [Candidatus Woesearchaeota archaeon]|nr:MAG: hypothetical protein KatS3mg002_0492 [Candidatus Woesearchaeota archaeon]